MGNRRQLTAAFKAKVAILAIQGHKTVNEIASEFGVHPTQVSSWKKMLLESSTEAFTRKNAKTVSDYNVERDQLFRQIGQLTVENDFLKKNLGHLD